MRTLRRRWAHAAEILSDLLVEIPLRYPLRVEVVKNLRVDGERCYGGTFLSKRAPRRFTIRLNAGQGRDQALDTLLHEYAHAVAWKAGDHGREWGVAYAKAYRCAMRKVGA